jgi:hypothetical protein
MSIQPEWKQKYKLLEEYVKANSEICIHANEVSIPEQLREHFYKLFDDIRNAFIDPVYSSLPFEMDALRKNYARSEKELLRTLKLERIDLPVDLSSFLSNPKKGMQRWLYNRLFEMIQGKITENDFERMAGFDLSATAEEMFQIGYEVWAVLSMILLLEPDEAFSVELNDANEPVAAELREIALGRQSHDSTKRIPEFVLHSKRLDRYVAFKTPLAREVDAYYIPYEIPKKMMRDNTGDTSSVLDSRVMLLSILPDLKNIPIVIDMHTRKINSPDLMIEFLTKQNMTDPDAVSQVQNRADIMKPKHGSSIVVINPDPEAEIINPEGNIDTFAAGLDALKLQPIIDKLA